MALSKPLQGTPRRVPEQSPRPSSCLRPFCESVRKLLFPLLNFVIERPVSDSAHWPKFHLKKQRAPGRIKSFQEGLDHSWDAYAIGQAFAVLNFGQQGEHYD